MSEPKIIDDGGPAFPLFAQWDSVAHPDGAVTHGMSLRDYFAAKAMQALITSGDSAFKNVPTGHMPEVAAVTAYQFADAMLVERSKTP